ncbi:hypothetical protein F5B20DRAFT_581142 [Whalleya microplaca]|nr:hypothetical protein F5B20DRAFT_581142 [Whalleya microplaca]
MASRARGPALMAMAEQYRDKYNLNSDGLLHHAEMMMSFERKISYLSFIQLVAVLTDPARQVPAWLCGSTIAVEKYTEAEMNLIVLLIESRFWLAQTKDNTAYFWHWYIVWRLPRRVHREMMRSYDWTNLHAITGHRKFEWLKTWSEHQPESYGAGYETLRASFFPTGIDDAVVGFLEHCKQIKTAIKKLRRCLAQLGEHEVVGGTALISLCSKQIDYSERLIRNIFHQAKKWYKEVLQEVERMQLPGTAVGFKFGKDVCIDFKNEKIEANAFLHDPQNQWFRDMSFETSLIRLKPGTRWGDYMRNTEQPCFAHMRHKNCHDLVASGRHLYTPGPVEIALPDPIYIALYYFYKQYEWAYSLHKKAGDLTYPYHEELEIPSFFADKEKQEEQDSRAVMLSNSTGQPYWKVREYRVFLVPSLPPKLLLGTSFVSAALSACRSTLNCEKAKKPIYDGAGNLRLYYMNCIVNELTGSPPTRVREEFADGDARENTQEEDHEDDCDDKEDDDDDEPVLRPNDVRGLLTCLPACFPVKLNKGKRSLTSRRAAMARRTTGAPKQDQGSA